MFSYRRLALRRRVIVNLKTDKALAGVLVKKTGPLLELAEVALLELGREPVKMDGRALVERSNVDFVQVIGEG